MNVSPYTGRRYERPHVDMRATGDRLEPWSCRCSTKRYKRHIEPWQCLTDADLLPWWAAHPEYQGPPDRARRLAYLEFEFSQEAKTGTRSTARSSRPPPPATRP